jgi:hypothetical protein
MKDKYYKKPCFQVFVDAQTELEVSAATDFNEEVKVASNNEVMGDSVG